MNKSELIYDYVRHCTDEELLQICSDLIDDLPRDSIECEEWNNHREPQYQLAYDVMNDELCEESVRKYLAEKLNEFPETIEKLFEHCWKRLFSNFDGHDRPTKGEGEAGTLCWAPNWEGMFNYALAIVDSAKHLEGKEFIAEMLDYGKRLYMESMGQGLKKL